MLFECFCLDFFRSKYWDKDLRVSREVVLGSISRGVGEWGSELGKRRRLIESKLLSKL